MDIQAIRLFHLALRRLGFDDEQKRMILRNCGGVASTKDLDPAGFEDCMAVLEDAGFRHQGKPDTYWRDIVARRGSFANSRMVRLIEQLAAQQKYDLAGLCRRFSGERVARPDQLRPGEAHKLINALREIVARKETNQPGDNGLGKAAGGSPEQRLPITTTQGTPPAVAGV